MIKLILSVLLFTVASSTTIRAQNNPLIKDPWTKSQLMEPAYLASIINKTQGSNPQIYNIGVMENIKGSKNMGGVSEAENLNKFKKAIENLPKNTSVVVYCGCCPFSRCPNIRPAFNVLKAAGLKNIWLLNLPTNVKVDWIDKGYPMD